MSIAIRQLRQDLEDARKEAELWKSKHDELAEVQDAVKCVCKKLAKTKD